jgi:glycosyltransferase involved in cell wall biosynthesis
MIVKNEMERYLPLAVEHLLTYVDEVRVLDDGSTDGSFEYLSAKTGVEVLRNPGPHFFEHEGRARQNLLNFVFQAKPDYVLGIDADEFVGDPEKIRAAIDQEGRDVYLLTLVEAWKVGPGGISIRIDGLWGPRKVPMLYRAPSLWPPRRGMGEADWRIQDKQLACGREPLAVIKGAGRAPLIDTHIFHFGWTRESEREARAERYFVHDQGRFHQDRHLRSILFPDDKVGLRGLPWPEGLRPLADDLMAYSDR